MVIFPSLESNWGSNGADGSSGNSNSMVVATAETAAMMVAGKGMALTAAKAGVTW